MKKVVRLTENELRTLIAECVIQYQQDTINEGKWGNIARTAALGAGLAGGMLGGMNNANAQVRIPMDGRTNKPSTTLRYSQADLDKAIDSTYNVLRRGSDLQLDKNIQQQMQDNIALKRYQDSVMNHLSGIDSVNNTEIEQSPAFRAIDSVNNAGQSVKSKRIIKGNGSVNPNDYQYKLIITPIGRIEHDTIPTGNISINDVINITRNTIETKVQRYTDKTPIFTHTFNSYDEFIQYLPKIMSKLQKDNNSNYAYRFNVTVIGLSESDYYSRGNYANSNGEFDHSGDYVYGDTFITLENPKSIDHLVSYQVKDLVTPIVKTIKQYGNYENQFRTPNDVKYLGYDKNGNKIYQNKDGVKYVWDDSSEEFVPMNKINSFGLEDLDEKHRR